MYRVGIDIGSTYTKYCVMNECREIIELYSEKTPIRQQEYFEKKLEDLTDKYGAVKIVSCGYGRKNIESVKKINELTALAIGSHFVCPETGTVLDIGGQDTKIIRQQDGRLKEFFLNDKCAAGSGIFFANICSLLGIDALSLNLAPAKEPEIKLSSVCAVFAQSEIVELLAENVSGEVIVRSVLWQILTKAKVLLDKIEVEKIFLSGGMAYIKGFAEYAQLVLGKNCMVNDKSMYLSAIGAALYCFKRC